MALDMFLSFDSNKLIKGESKAAGFESCIEILAWSWGASQSGTLHHGEGGGAGKSNIQDISVTKYVEGSSADIAKCTIMGEHIAEAKLTVRKAGGINAKQVEAIVITLTDCMLTSYSTGGSGGEDRLTENLTINFAKIQYVTNTQAKKGDKAAAGDLVFNIPTQTLG